MLCPPPFKHEPQFVIMQKLHEGPSVCPTPSTVPGMG